MERSQSKAISCSCFFVNTDKVVEGDISGEIKRTLSLPFRTFLSSTACTLPSQAQIGGTFSLSKLHVSREEQNIMDNEKLHLVIRCANGTVKEIHNYTYSVIMLTKFTE